MLHFSSVVFIYVGIHGYSSRPLDGILSIHETPEWLRGFENVTGPYVHITVRRTWVKFQFSAN